MSSEKEKILELEKTNRYVFHGSGLEIDEFEPRQAHNYTKGENVPDGDPAVFASSVADYAILMAVINKNNCPKGLHSSAGSSTNDGKKYFMRYRASKDTLAQLNDESSGWVYVFDRNLFDLRDKGGIEYVSKLPVKPLQKIKVKKEDLPHNIEIFE